MQYHIQTSPIWEAFKSNCACPMCALYEKSADRLVAQYLNEAVMEPAYRVQLNKRGFCARHLRKLFAGKNKLGLALQLHTRTGAVLDQLSVDDTYKQAKKQAENLKKTLDTCVICDTVDEMMTRYAYTVAQMYVNEKEFPAIFRKSNGFCMPHYILLLENSEKAGRNIRPYLNDLTGLQIATLSKVNHSTEQFTLRFDYRNNGSGGVPDPGTIPTAIAKLKGYL